MRDLTTSFNLWRLLLLFTAIFSTTRAEQLVLLSLAKDKEIQTWALDEETGNLTRRSTTKTSGQPSAMCINPSGTRLYTSMKESNSIVSFEIKGDGSLLRLGEAKVGAHACYLSLHPDGQHLLSAYYKAGQVAVHPLQADKGLSPEVSQILPTDERAHSIVLDPSGKFVFVPHTRPNSIYQFRFDTKTNKLVPNQPTKLLREPRSGPRHLCFHPRLHRAYGSDEQGRSATTYAYAPSSGTLSKLQTITSLPKGGYEGRHSTSDIEVHPSGNFVYLANRGYNMIAVYRVDSEDGKLHPIHHTPTEAVTRSFNLSPDGKFLVAAGQNSGNLATFRIANNGQLKRLSTTAAGKNPWWVQFIPRPR